jgi:hypothetical protein
MDLISQSRLKISVQYRSAGRVDEKGRSWRWSSFFTTTDQLNISQHTGSWGTSTYHTFHPLIFLTIPIQQY